jgi:hypothetical protein
VLRAPVRAGDGRQIGEVKDIIVNRHGHIERLVVEVGGFLGFDHAVSAYPVERLTALEPFDYARLERRPTSQESDTGLS